MTNLALYQLSGELQQVAAKLAEDGLDAQTIRDTIESISGPFEEKAKSAVSVARSYEALAAQIKDAEAQMAKRRKALENSAARIREYVLGCMVAGNVERVESPFFVLSVAANPPAVDVFDAKQVPDEFWRQPPIPEKEIDKTAIKAALTAGQDVPGARLVRGVRLAVR